MFQNQTFQVKCFNLETFEIFQTCPAGGPLQVLRGPIGKLEI